MDYFFNPRTVALIGASSKKGKVGNEILNSLLKTNAHIYPVNPYESEIAGLKCYSSLKAIPDSIDIAVVSLAASQISKVMEEADEKKVKGIVIISGGFKEISDEGLRMEKEIKEKSKTYGIRVIGPNCIGVYSGSSNFDTFFQAREAMKRPECGNIAFITQSGTYGVTLLEYLEENRLGVSKFVSFGNKVDVNEIDMLNYLEQDEETRIIAAYLENIDDGSEFFKVCKKVSNTKPVVVLKTGRTGAGNTAAKSHTGAMAQNYEVYKGAMKQAGVITVDDIEEMVDILKILAFQPLPKTGTLAMVTNGAGPCVVTADEVGVSKNLNLINLSGDTVKDLKQILPEFAVIANPLDLTGSASYDWYRAGIEALAKEEELSMIVIYFVIPNAPVYNFIDKIIEVVKETKKLNKTVVVVMAGGEFTKKVEKELESAKVPVLTTARRLVNALDKIVEYSNWLAGHN